MQRLSGICGSCKISNSKDIDVPLLPPNYYIESGYMETDHVVSSSYYAYLKHTMSNRFNKKKNVEGALYLFPYVQGYYYLDTFEWYHTDIILQQSSKIHGIRIRTVFDENLFSSIRVLGDLLLQNNSNARNNQMDCGVMYALGYRDCNREILYKMTTDEHIGNAMRVVCRFLYPICKSYFPDEYNNITENSIVSENNNKLYQLGGDNYYMGDHMYFSCDYINSSHLDFLDDSVTIGIWVEKQPGSATHWNFVYPDMSINQSNGVLVRLKTGLIMSWNGSEIRHCSTVSNVGRDNHVYGLAFTRKRKKIVTQSL